MQPLELSLTGYDNVNGNFIPGNNIRLIVGSEDNLRG
uniref:Uncharacterized protein n=1 Tax=Rhizophora mucronata TaxID=61149 RepID=A0A2P2PDL6_RHIMU